MKVSMTGQEKYDLLIQVTVWAGLTVLKHEKVLFCIMNCDVNGSHVINIILRGMIF